MGRRLSIYDRAAEITASATAIQAWRAETRAQKSASYATSRVGLKLLVGSTPGFIHLFTESPTEAYVLEVGLLTDPIKAPNLNQRVNPVLIKAVIGGVEGGANKYAFSTTTSGAIIIQGLKVKPARVRAKVILVAGVPKVSRITGHPYSHVDTDTASSAFGPAGTNVTEAAAFLDISNIIKVAIPTAATSYSSQGKFKITTAPAPVTLPAPV